MTKNEYANETIKLRGRFSYLAFIEQSVCPFVSFAQIYAHNWLRTTVGANVDAQVSCLLHGLSMVGDDDLPLDMISFEIPSKLVETPEDASEFLRYFFSVLSEKIQQDHFAGCDNPDWRLFVGEVSTFTSFFGSFYPTNHTRCSHDQNWSLLNFQPTASFKSLLDTVEKREQAGVLTSRNVSARGNIYPKMQLEVDKIILPLEVDGNPVQWHIDNS